MNIDYYILSDAIKHYDKYGFKYVEAPWYVPSEINAITKPNGVYGFHLDCENFKGELVGSGEQSFIKMMVDDRLPHGKYMCVTPCFRDEPNGYDELHQPYFMKLELINTVEINHTYGLNPMISQAQEFFCKYLDRAWVSSTFDGFWNGGTDILSWNKRIELGSYGLRKYGKYQWAFGTGVALPRLSIAIQKEREFLEQSKQP